MGGWRAAIRGLDHVCVVVRDMPVSVSWYQNVFGMQHIYTDTPNFWPRCEDSPAFLRASGGASIALLRLEPGSSLVKNHNGAHFAMNVPQCAFELARDQLPAILRENRVHPGQSVDVEFQDYGIQHSLFFTDPDHNVVELACWPHPPLPGS